MSGKRYHTSKGVQDKLMLDIYYPNPVYFDRPGNKLAKRDLQRMLHERAEEVRRIITIFEGMAHGGATNDRLRDAINVLHDFRVSAGFYTAEGPGRPHFWEE